MNTVIPKAKMLIIGALAAGTLSLGAAGVAGAATTAPAASRVAAHVTCADATRVLTRIDSIEARIAAGLPRLTAAQHLAAESGRTVRADRLQRRITRLESARFRARLARVATAIEAACHVSAPATSGAGSGAGHAA